MSRRRELDSRLKQLTEIGEILRSMKNLALLETRKLAQTLAAETETLGGIEAAGRDFMQFFAPPNPPPLPDQRRLIIVFGSERGFCGDYNDELVRALHEALGIGCRTAHADREDAPATLIFAVGVKLALRLEREALTRQDFTGALVAEEALAVLDALLPAIAAASNDGGYTRLSTLAHRPDGGGIALKPLLPPYESSPATDRRLREPPLLYLSPEAFYSEWLRHYLFAALHETLCAALLAENQRRIQHLEGADRRLEETRDQLARRSRSLRQEEITEEIEVILLHAEEVGQPGKSV